MRVALVHYWLVGMRGGERVMEALCRIFPDADIYTHVLDRSRISATLKRHRIETTFIDRLPFSKRLYKSYLPLMPYALEALDLSDYDVVISNESGPAKGIIPRPDAVHVSYVQSPMRYIWDKYHVYRDHAGFVSRRLMLPISHKLRIWDVTTAARVDRFIANSRFIARRIEKYYRRESDIVFPPVAVEDFAPVAASELGDYYLWTGELVSYKRPDIAVEAFRRSRRKLVIIGDGPERKSLERLARDAPITFLGKTGFDVLRHHMARCRALVFPGVEDFGIVPVEAQASGRPVVALGRGGIRDTVIDGETGLFYDDCSADGLLDALDRFEASGLERDGVEQRIAHARTFGETEFRARFVAALGRAGITPPAL
jgi:glycosyltransferase involved in cell wall biosynthesis